MQRRHFLALTAAAAATAPLAAHAGGDMVEYTPGLVKERLAAGETVFLDIATDWCTTCRSQERTIQALRADNPAYDEAITFVRMDWDVHANSALANELQIPRRSTLVVLKGDAELGRVVAQTSQATIRNLMDTALAAALA